ncbi:hypothetical protein AB0392_16355 [Nonomuraea angiospora]|uniref:hypothetical protein n=1 Tax=Nonomuraea angiospora TaxID=46172 RepID=UPI00344D37C3
MTTVVLGMAGLRLDRGTAHRPARLLLFGLMTALYYVTLPWLVTPAVATVSS